MSRYAIWNKNDNILTPIGEVLTAEQWVERHPLAGIESITVVCGGGEINGSFFGTLGQMVEMYSKEGCDFSACTTAEEKIAAIETFEDERNARANAEARARAVEESVNAEITATALASIAASMEYQNMLTLDDAEV